MHTKCLSSHGHRTECNFIYAYEITALDTKSTESNYFFFPGCSSASSFACTGNQQNSENRGEALHYTSSSSKKNRAIQRAHSCGGAAVFPSYTSSKILDEYKYNSHSCRLTLMVKYSIARYLLLGLWVLDHTIWSL